MENQNGTKEKPNGDLLRWIQTILMTLITAGLIGFYSKMTDISDRMIRMEERAITNTENIANMQSSMNAIRMEQQRASDRMTKLEFEINEKDSNK